MRRFIMLSVAIACAAAQLALGQSDPNRPPFYTPATAQVQPPPAPPATPSAGAPAPSRLTENGAVPVPSASVTDALDILRQHLKQAAASYRTENTPAPVEAPVAPGPGRDSGAGFRACNPGDSTPAGTVVDGFRKMVLQTPFGQSCRWEAAPR